MEKTAQPPKFRSETNLLGTMINQVAVESGCHLHFGGVLCLVSRSLKHQRSDPVLQWWCVAVDTCRFRCNPKHATQLLLAANSRDVEKQLGFENL